MKRVAGVVRIVVVLTLLSLLSTAALTRAGVTRAAPDTGDSAGGSLLFPALQLLLNTLGDDAFSLVNISAAMSPMNATQHYGPYASGSPDSGTCGNNWAEDTYDRHFTVHNNRDGTYTVVEQFKNGSFVTNAGPSPGACDTTDGSSGTLISAGKTGSMHGYEIITVAGTQISQDESCIAGMPSAPCTTAGFISSHFAGASTVGTYFFHYSAGAQGLSYHEWKNASEDRGGNHGDIADAP
jgi:hypothetical protein